MPVLAPFVPRMASGLPAIGPDAGRPPCSRMSAIKAFVQASGSQLLTNLPPSMVSSRCAGNDLMKRRRMPPGSGSDAQLCRRDRDVRQLAVPLELDLDRATNEVADERPLEIADARDRPPVKRDDQVAGADSRQCRGACVQEL